MCPDNKYPLHFTYLATNLYYELILYSLLNFWKSLSFPEPGSGCFGMCYWCGQCYQGRVSHTESGHFYHSTQSRLGIFYILTQLFSGRVPTTRYFMTQSQLTPTYISPSSYKSTATGCLDWALTTAWSLWIGELNTNKINQLDRIPTFIQSRIDQITI